MDLDKELDKYKAIGFKGFCHFVEHIETKERHLIPMCWGSIHSDDLSNCHCRKRKAVKSDSDKKINDYISYLESQIKQQG